MHCVKRKHDFSICSFIQQTRNPKHVNITMHGLRTGGGVADLGYLRRRHQT